MHAGHCCAGVSSADSGSSESMGLSHLVDVVDDYFVGIDVGVLGLVGGAYAVDFGCTTFD